MMITRLLCFVIGHRWSRASYQGADTPDGYFLRCRRCAKEKETPVYMPINVSGG